MVRNVAQLVEYLPTMQLNLRFPPHYHRHDGTLLQFQNPGSGDKRIRHSRSSSVTQCVSGQPGLHEILHQKNF